MRCIRPPDQGRSPIIRLGWPGEDPMQGLEVGGERVGVEVGFDAFGFREHRTKRRLRGDPVDDEPHFATSRREVGDHESTEPFPQADLQVLLVSHSNRSFRAWLICFSMTSPAFCMLPSASRSQMRVRQHGQRTAAWATTSAYWTQTGYSHWGQSTSRSPWRSWVVSDSPIAQSC